MALYETARGYFPGGPQGWEGLHSAATAFLIRVVSAAILYLSQIALARWMGEFDYGIYVLMWTFVLVLGGMCHLGLNLALIRLIPEHRAAGDAAAVRGLIRGSRALALGLGAVVAIVLALVLEVLRARVPVYDINPAFLALVCLPFYALSDVQDGIGRGHGWIGLALAPPYLLRPLVILLIVAFAYKVGLPTTASTALAAAMLATAIAGFTQMFALDRRLSASLPPGPVTYDLKASLAVSLPLLVMGAAEILLQTIDVMVLSRVRPPSDVGIYYAAGKTMSLIMFVHYAVGSAMAHRLAALNARGDVDTLAATIRQANAWTFLPALALAVLILFAGKPLLSLFGSRFVDGYPVMMIIVLGYLARAAAGPAEHVLNVLGRQATAARVLVLAAGVDLAFSLALTPMYGIKGAAVSTALALTFAAVANRWFSERALAERRRAVRS